MDIRPFNSIDAPNKINVHELNVPNLSKPSEGYSLNSRLSLKRTTMIPGTGFRTIQNKAVWMARYAQERRKKTLNQVSMLPVPCRFFMFSGPPLS
jgi:hypothetical protein